RPLCRSCPRGIRPDREGGCALGHPGRLYLPARTARVSALHVSPRAVHVARDRSTTVYSRSRRRVDHGGGFIRCLRYLAERAAASGSAVALSAWRKALSPFKSFKRVKPFKTFETERSWCTE